MVTRSEVEDLRADGWQALDGTKKDNLIDIATRQVDDLYSGRVATLGEIEGDTDDLKKLVSAHLFELAEGGEAQSESSTGGSVNYNTVTGETYAGWSETRYGRQALEYIRDEQSIGLVTTK